ncbi:MAG: DoxX family protein [Labilithrix sp.]|nr:DoxX family protein [Labilithrix sp.]
MAFLAFDAAIKIALYGPAVEGSAKLGFTPSAVVALGALELVMILLYLVPRTAPIGAVLWTGYLGGAICVHVQQGDPWLSHTLFPIYVAVMLWLPLFLRDERVRNLLVA